MNKTWKIYSVSLIIPFLCFYCNRNGNSAEEIKESAKVRYSNIDIHKIRGEIKNIKNRIIERLEAKKSFIYIEQYLKNDFYFIYGWDSVESNAEDIHYVYNGDKVILKKIDATGKNDLIVTALKKGKVVIPSNKSAYIFYSKPKTVRIEFQYSEAKKTWLIASVTFIAL